MTEKVTPLGRSVTAMPAAAAKLSFATAIAFVLLLAALHLIKPELDPSWRFISEYAIGKNGWIMTLAFLTLALSYIALFIAVRSYIGTIGGWLGMAFLLVSAVGLIIAAVFTTDPITTGPDAVTTAGKLHNLGGTLGMAMPLATVITSWSLSRRPAWLPARRALLLAAGLALVGFLVSFLSLGVVLSQSGGEFGPGVLVGWPTRFELLTYCVWLVVVAWYAARIPQAR